MRTIVLDDRFIICQISDPVKTFISHCRKAIDISRRLWAGRKEEGVADGKVKKIRRKETYRYIVPR